MDGRLFITACSFFLVYSPNGQSAVIDDGNVTIEQRQQVGAFCADGSVDTSSSPAANNVNLLVNTLLLNYMVLNDGADAGIYNFQALFTAAGMQHG